PRIAWKRLKASGPCPRWVEDMGGGWGAWIGSWILLSFGGVVGVLAISLALVAGFVNADEPGSQTRALAALAAAAGGLVLVGAGAALRMSCGWGCGDDCDWDDESEGHAHEHA